MAHVVSVHVKAQPDNVRDYLGMVAWAGGGPPFSWEVDPDDIYPDYPTVVDVYGSSSDNAQHNAERIANVLSWDEYEYRIGDW